MQRIDGLIATAVVALLGATGAAQVVERPQLAGRWEMNRELSTPPGSGDVPDAGDRPDAGRGPGGMGPGGGRGGFGGPGGGGRGGGGFGGGPGGGGRGGGMPQRPSAEEMERLRALMQEVMLLPPRFTLAQKDDTVTFIEPDGVVRSYVANGKSEKHQLTNGVVETKTAWKGEVLEMELKVDRITLKRTFALRAGETRQLEVTTTASGGRRGGGPTMVFDQTEPQ